MIHTIFILSFLVCPAAKPKTDEKRWLPPEFYLLMPQHVSACTVTPVYMLAKVWPVLLQLT